jgi:hypothetical protein
MSTWPWKSTEPPALKTWACGRCGEAQVAWGPLPADGRCHACRDRAEAASSRVEEAAGIPRRYRGLTRATWERHFARPWPLAPWNGQPHWLALWGPTGTGKTGLGTVLLAEHLRTGRSGRWISGSSLADQLRGEIGSGGDVLAALRVTSLLVLDEPVITDPTLWYWDRLGALCRARDEEGRATVLTLQLPPEELLAEDSHVPPPLVSRWLSGVRRRLGGDDVRLRPEEA